MSKSTTSERLKYLLQTRNLKQVQVLEMARPYCQKYGIEIRKNDLSQYVSGKVRPGQERLTILSLALNVSETWLMGYDVPMERESDRSKEQNRSPLPSNILPLPKTRKVPLLGTIACGEPILAAENIEAYIDVAEDIRCDFVLRCKGDSMIEARIYDGDVVYIRTQPDVENGEIAAVLIDGMETEATLKRVYKTDDQIKLIPANSTHEPFFFSGPDMAKVRIVGKAVAFTSVVR